MEHCDGEALVYEQGGYWCVDVVSFGGIQSFKFNHRDIAEAFARSTFAAKLELERKIIYGEGGDLQSLAIQRDYTAPPPLNTEDVLAEVDMILKGDA